MPSPQLALSARLLRGDDDPISDIHAALVASRKRTFIHGEKWDKTAIPVHDRACQVSDKPAVIIMDGSAAALRLQSGQSPASRDC